MEETLTFARVIENINYVYGEKLVKAILLFFVIEVFVYTFLLCKKPDMIKKFRIVIFSIAIAISAILAWRAHPYVAYDKFQCSDTICSAKYILNQKDYDKFNWADSNIYRYHYYKQHPDELSGEDFETKFGSGKSHLELDESVLCEDKGIDYAKQSLACFLIYAVGFFLVKCVLLDKNKLFAGFLAVPIGASVIVALTVSFLIFHIKYSFVSFFCGLLLVSLGIYLFLKHKHVRWDRSVTVTLLIALIVIVLATYVRFYQFSGDSRWQLIFAMNLLDEGLFSKWSFAQATTFGFFGISLHALALLFGTDYLYAYYLIMGLAGVGIFLSSAYLFSDEFEKKKTVFLYLVGLVILLFNFDFEYYSFSVLSNASMGVCMLAIVVLTLFEIKYKKNVSLLLALISFVLLTTRIEGVCYVVLFMGIPFEREMGLKQATIISGVEIIIWQIAQFFYSDGSGVDGWTPTMGVALMFVGLLLIAEPYLVKFELFRKIGRYYKVMYIVGLLAIICFGFYYDMIMASDNFVVFLSHIAVSKYSNSLSIWVFLLYLLPFAIVSSLKEENSILIIIFAYFLMVFGISIFRTGNPLNTEISDSFRRIICQMMFMAVWLILYYAGDYEGKNICRKQ